MKSSSCTVCNNVEAGLNVCLNLCLDCINKSGVRKVLDIVLEPDLFITTPFSLLVDENFKFNFSVTDSPLFVINTDFEFEPKKFCAMKANPFGDDKNLPILKVSVNILFKGTPSKDP